MRDVLQRGEGGTTNRIEILSAPGELIERRGKTARESYGVDLDELGCS